MTPRALAQRRRVLFTMLTALGFRYTPGCVPPLITRAPALKFTTTKADGHDRAVREP